MNAGFACAECGKVFISQEKKLEHELGHLQENAEIIVTPPWLNAMVDQRLALMKDTLTHHGQIPEEYVALSIGLQYSVMLTPLTEPAEGASRRQQERWERSCDRCNRYVPKGRKFFTGYCNREAFGTTVTFMYGACPDCAGTKEK